MSALNLTDQDGMAQVWFVDVGGPLSGGPDADNELLRTFWWLRPLLVIFRFSAMKRLQARMYRWVADNRYRLPGGSADCEMKLPA